LTVVVFEIFESIGFASALADRLEFLWPKSGGPQYEHDAGDADDRLRQAALI